MSIIVVCLMFIAFVSVSTGLAKEKAGPGLLKLKQNIQLFEDQQLDETGVLLCIVNSLYDMAVFLEACEGDAACNTQAIATFIIDVISCIPEED